MLQPPLKFAFSSYDVIAENLKHYSGGVASGGNYTKFHWHELMLS